MHSAVVGFPRVGKLRELKFASEKYFRKEITQEELKSEAKKLRLEQFDEYEEAKAAGIKTKPVLIGAYTFLKLAKYPNGKSAEDYKEQLVAAYGKVLEKFCVLGAEWIQFDEPALVMDMTEEDKSLFSYIYKKLLNQKDSVKVLLQTYFGDIRDCYELAAAMDFDGIGLDFIEGKKSFELVNENGFPADKVLFAGLVNGKNIWKSRYDNILEKLKLLRTKAPKLVLSTSCSLLHVPYTLENETKLLSEVKKHFAFAKEKLTELSELSKLAECEYYKNEQLYKENEAVFGEERLYRDASVRENTAALTDEDFVRKPERKVRAVLQREEFKLTLLPTTTIGSFPQTKEVKANRSSYRKGEINKADYDKKVFELIEDCIRKQEELGFDVLVHGEYERNDMVEFFGENLAGYVFTEKAWVQSYGTRCVKPPVIFGDIKCVRPITVKYSVYAQSLTNKPVKGMLTGPVTILNWSFPREDISLKEMAYQIGIAIREEVLDLEKAGIRMIQIDEAALKEKLPIRKSDWYSEYLDWAIPAFRLCHSGVSAKTQIHTHMCYSEFDDIINDIDNMDADVISFEASRSKLTILDSLKSNNFETEVGPGVYDIHSPRVPSVEEIVEALEKILLKVDIEKLWVNPDCGLKTRGVEETGLSLANMVAAAHVVRDRD